MPLSAPGSAPTLTAANTPAYRPDPRLTGQQTDIITAAHGGGTVVAEALAGTGKTSTLVEVARSFPGRPTVYLAFNKSVQIEAEKRFPGWVRATTAHSLAYQAVGKQYADRLNSRRMPAKMMASQLKVKPAMLDTGTLNPVILTRMAQATVFQFLKTADPEVAAHHVPARVLAHHSPTQVTEAVMPIAHRIWADLRKPTGRFFFNHDVYLKLWQLTNPVIPADLIMFDEAQDADPVIAAIVARQAAQRLYVGDRNQAIYGWRGAVDAMSRVKDATRLPLTKSFRFGPAIAEIANQWLGLLGSKHQVVGHDPIRSSIGDLLVPRAILCRTNGTALGWVLAFHERGVPVALAPGDKNAGKDIERFAWAARDLMNGEGTDHPDLVGFTTWRELVDFVEEEENTADLKRMVGIINRIGINGVIDAVRKLVPEERAQVTVSTAHKAKGLEWTSVKVADDFVPPEFEDDDEMVDPADLMLAYVTVTRAQHVLDPGALGSPELWTR
jgi:hypothetical protein